MPKSFLRRVVKQILIVANVITALVFLLACYGYLIKPSLFWPIGFLSLTAFYFLLMLLVFALVWLFIKPGYMLISIITFLFAYFPINNIIPLRMSHEFKNRKSDKSIRIMSWNVAQFDVLNKDKKPETRNKMFDLINEYQPDIACFQEMVAEDSTITEHGHIREFMEKLNFKDYYYSYNPKEDFWGYAHFGVIIFSKYPIIKKKTVGWYPKNYNSIFQYIDIVKDGDTLRVFNMHLESLRFSNANLEYIDKPSVEDVTAIKESKNIIVKFKKGFLKRQVQAERIKAEVDKSPYPVIVSGDFNDVPNSYAYFTIGKGLNNAFVEKGGGLGRTFSGISPVLRIDNIFVDKRLEVKQFLSIRKKLSDHFPIIADVQLNKK